MAEAAILLAVKKIDVALGGEAPKLASSLFANKISTKTELPIRMRRIKGKLLLMHNFLGQMDTQTDNNRVLEALVEEVRKLAYHVEDIMDEYIYLIAQQQGSGLGGYLKKIVKGSQNLIAYRQIAAQLKELETNLVHISQTKKRFIGMRDGEMGGNSNYACEWEKVYSRKLELEELKPDGAWNLFRKKAFQKDKGRCPPENLGKELASRCRGLPLAIVCLGSLLSLRERTESEWVKVRNQLSWELQNNTTMDRVEQVLNLSYNHLPRYLKNCFLHCSMFPEDHVLRRKRLIRLWVAEGFVEKRGSRTMEEVAEDCLKELVDRCLLQVADRNEFGRIKKCRMHDVVRDFAVSLSKKENFSSVLDDLKVVVDMSDVTRRLSVHKYSNEIQSSMELPRLRTFTVFDPTKSLEKSFSSLCSGSRYLTVLDLKGAPVERVPEEIGKLFNLRLLGLRDTKVKVLPKSLGKLRNLQTLDLKQTEIKELPSTTRNLKKLRHLLAEKILDRNFMTLNDRRGVRAPMGLWNLKDLQTLRTVEANEEFVRHLGNLTELRSLRIWKVRGNQCKHLCKSLSSLPHLSFLSLNASNENETLRLEGWDRPTQHLLKLTLKGRLEKRTMPSFRDFAAGLQILTLRLSGLEVDPLPSLSQLTNLANLTLQDAYDGQRLCFREGWFPKLKQLQLGHMPLLSQVKVKDRAMEKLEFLLLDGLPSLMRVPQGIEYLTTLEELYLRDLCPDFRRTFETSNDRNRVEHIPMAYYVVGRDDQAIYERLF